MDSPRPPTLTLTMRELAAELGIDPSTAWRWLKNGTLDVPVFHIGTSPRVRRADVEDYLARKAEEAREEQAVIAARRRR